MENTAEIKDLFDRFYLHEKDLTPGQSDFIQGCKKYFTRNKSLSEKQLSTLFDMARHLNSEPIRTTMQTYDYTTHHKMPKIKTGRKKRKTKYKGIQDIEKKQVKKVSSKVE